MAIEQCLSIAPGPHRYELGFTIEQHRDELIARLGNAIRQLNEMTERAEKAEQERDQALIEQADHAEFTAATIARLTERAEKAEQERDEWKARFTESPSTSSNHYRKYHDSSSEDFLGTECVNCIHSETALREQLATQASRIAELQAVFRELLDALCAGNVYMRESADRYIAAKRKARELLAGPPKAEPEGEK